MSAPAIVMLVLVGSFVWGGFLALLVRAVRREGAKRAEGPGPSP